MDTGLDSYPFGPCWRCSAGAFPSARSSHPLERLSSFRILVGVGALWRKTRYAGRFPSEKRA